MTMYAFYNTVWPNSVALKVYIFNTTVLFENTFNKAVFLAMCMCIELATTCAHQQACHHESHRFQ